MNRHKVGVVVSLHAVYLLDALDRLQLLLFVIELHFDELIGQNMTASVFGSLQRLIQMYRGWDPHVSLTVFVNCLHISFALGLLETD